MIWEAVGVVSTPKVEVMEAVHEPATGFGGLTKTVGIVSAAVGLELDGVCVVSMAVDKLVETLRGVVTRGIWVLVTASEVTNAKVFVSEAAREPIEAVTELTWASGEVTEAVGVESNAVREETKDFKVVTEIFSELKEVIDVVSETALEVTEAFCVVYMSFCELKEALGEE